MSSLPSLTRQSLAEHINQDIATCNDLLQLLNAERQALSERNLPLLEDIIYQKSTALKNLEQNADLRAKWVSLSRNAQRTTMDERWRMLIHHLDPSLEGRWDELKAMLAECRACNDVNGKILARKRATYSQLLKILRGQSDSDNLYSAKGGAQRGGYGRNPLGSA